MLLPLLSIIILLSAQYAFAEGKIVLSKNIYSTEETVKIILDNVSANDTLSIISDQNVFKYSGELKDELDFYPKEAGNYTIQLENNNQIIDEKNFLVKEDYAINAPDILHTDKKAYLINEPVLVSINATEEYDLTIFSETDVFKYLGMINSPLQFIPQALGKYSIELRKNFTPIATAEFSVAKEILQETKPNMSFGLGEEAQTAESSREEISQEEIMPLPEIPLPFKLSLKDKNGREEQANVMVLANTAEKYDLEIVPSKAGIGRIQLNNLIIDANKSFELDEILLKNEERKQNFDNKKIIRAYFIDTSQLNYTNGSITSLAAGKELWKCKEWSSTQQACLGSWNKIMDLTPGIEYEINLTPEDPAYVETGIASINTKKPIYHPGETAEIIMVVLDTAGHLVSNADVSLAITAPDNTSTILTTNQGNIIETNKGIYETSYSNTALEGNYSLDVRATGNNVNSTMLSYFTVKPYYEFDIIRDTPVTTDPWREIVNSKIRIISYTNATMFNFTEVLPKSFAIIDYGEAIVTKKNNNTYLTWTNLNNNSIVSYSTRPPLASPELYELGPSFVSYDDIVFYEARPWYLAVDPVTQNLLPDGDGNYMTWTISGTSPAPTRWQSVDDPVGGADDSVTYIASPDNTNRNSFTFQNLSQSMMTIQWAAVRVRARRSATGGSATLQIFYRQNGADYNNVNTQALPTTWTNYSLSGWNYTTNPVTGVAWNTSAINNMEWGVLRNASGSGRLAWVTQMYITVGYSPFPNITNLSNPGNNTILTNHQVKFNFTVIDDESPIANCTLWGSFNGSWAANQTVYDVSNNTNTNITVNVSDRTYTWNVQCTDTYGGSDFYKSNYTFTMDVDPPVKTIVNIDSSTSPPWNTTNRNPYINVSLNKNGTCRLSQQNKSYAEMSTDYNCTGGGTKVSNCTYTGSQLSIGNNTFFIACNDTSGHADTNLTNMYFWIDVLCDSHSDCLDTQYCDYTQHCHLDELTGFNCNDPPIVYAGLGIQEVCGNGTDKYCVNDSTYSYTGWYCTATPTDCVYNDNGNSYVLTYKLCILSANDYKTCSASNQWGTTTNCADQYDPYNQSATYHSGGYCGYYATSQACTNGTSGGCSGGASNCNPYVYNQTTQICGSTTKECDLGCGAACDPSNSTTPGIIGGICYYDKTCTNACSWSQNSEEAPMFCINDNDGGPCAYNNRTNPTNSETCYWNVVCQNTTGASLTQGTLNNLRADYCDYCNATGNQSAQYAPAPNASCYSNCADSGTIYYDTGGTPTNRSDDCSNGVSKVQSDTLTIGDVWNSTAPAYCNDTECDNDCGTLVGACNAGVCTCTDQDNPILILILPYNGNWTNNATVLFKYNITDISSGIQNCSLIVNGSINLTNNTINKSLSEQTFTQNFTNRTVNWSIRCYDNSSNHNQNQSAGRFLGIDTTIPISRSPNINGTNFTVNQKICLNITANDTYSGINQVIAQITPPGQPAENITLWDNVTTSCDTINGNGVYSAEYLIIFSGTYNWSVAYAIDFANNQNTTNPGLTWNVTTGGVLNITMTYPTTNIKINESEYNNYYLQNCTATCTDQGNNCSDVIIFAEYNNGAGFDIINTTTTQLINNQDSVLCGNITKNNNCSASFNITSGANSGNHTWPVRCRAGSSNSATVFSNATNVTINDHPYPALTYPYNDTWITGVININASTSYDSDGSITNYLFEYDNNTAFTSPDTICNGANSNCTWNTSQQNQCDNNTKSCYLRVTVTDNDGLSNNTYILLGFDTNGPITILDRPRNFENITTNTTTVNATAVDNEIGSVSTVTFEYRQNASDTWHFACNATAQPYQCVWNATTLPDGKTYEFRAYANDSLGNIGGTDAHTNITIDRAGPIINLENPPNNNFTTNNTVTFYYNTTDATSYVANCSLILNGIINQTNSTVQENQSQNFTANLTEGTYNWSINCTDILGNKNSSPIRNITVDTTGPTAVLDRPPNYAQITGLSYTVNASASDAGIGNISTVTFEYRQNASDTWQFACNDNRGPTYDCNWDLTNLPDGNDYQSRVWANDTLGNNGTYDTHTNITLDNNGPIISALAPADNAIDSDGNITFTYVVNDVASGITNCSLIINGTINQTNPSVVENSNSYFYLYNQNDTTLIWSIQCWDNFSLQKHMNMSENRTLIVQILYALKDNVTTDKSLYEKGNQQAETANITTKTFDYVNESIDAAVTTDIIKTEGESKNIWWNNTWEYRVRTTLNETEGVTRKSQWVHINFVLDPNCSNLAHKNSLRLIQDASTILDFNEWNVSTCTDTNYIKSLWVSFRLNLSANTGTNIYVYFDNETTFSKTSTSRGPMRLVWVSTGGSGNAPLSATIKSDLNNSLAELGLRPAGFYDELNTTAASADFNMTHLQNYSIVLYDSGAKYTRSWNYTEANALFQFVNQSGNLFLTGQELGYDANSDAWIYNAAFSNLTRVSAGWVDNANPLNFTVMANHPAVKYIGSVGTRISVVGDYEDGYTTLAGATSVEILNWTNSANPISGTANDGIHDPGCAGFCGKTVYYSGIFYISGTQGIQNATARKDFLKGSVEWFMDNSLTQTPGVLEQFKIRNSTNSTGASGIWSWLMNVNNLDNGRYEAVSQASKTKYNNATAWTTFNVTTDKTSPNVTLNSPSSGSEANSSVTFTYYVNDTRSSVSNCSLIIDEEIDDTRYDILEGPVQYFYPRIPLGGWHNWSVNCSDYYANIGASQTWQIFIRPPDLVITSSDINFNTTSPKEGANITINATVYNLGGSDAINVTTQFFLGDPDTGGTQLNGNFTANITEVTGNHPNVTFNITWLVPGPGPFNFYVVTDPPTATNGSIQELNESNNKANKTLNVPAYNYFYGSAENSIYLANSQNQSIYYYLNITNVTGNILVTDEGSTISFSTLQALGKDITNNTANNDYNDTDTTLNMTNYNDSIRKTWTANIDTPIATRSMTIFNKQINNIPITNSTNVSSFVTGILWDTSDGNTQYNGTQDILFVTQINESQTGAYGVYDYEIRIPVNLKNYHAPSAKVDFYWEITETMK